MAFKKEKFGITYFQNTELVDQEKDTIFCLHGNSSIAETFENVLDEFNKYNKKAALYNNILFVFFCFTILLNFFVEFHYFLEVILNCFVAILWFYLTVKKKLKSIQTIAVDLPGCGRSDRLDEYSMEILGDKMANFIRSFGIESDKIHLFGHSLGGHLASYISKSLGDDIKGIAIVGTPPLSSGADFPNAFNPKEYMKEMDEKEMNEELEEIGGIVKLLNKKEKFTDDEAEKFVGHTGVTGQLKEKMVKFAKETDGKFRDGCLSSLANMDQKKHLIDFAKKGKNVIVMHAKEDGVISLDYLNEFVKDKGFFENKVHLLEGKHMSPVYQAKKIVEILTRCINN